MRYLPLALVGALCAPLSASGQTPPEGATPSVSAPCDPSLPGYECFTKKDLWEASVRWRGKHRTEHLLLLEERVAHAATREKLAVRTSTAIRNLVVPPALPAVEGHSTSTLILSSGVALVAGVVITILVLKDSAPSTIVVK